MLELYHYGDSLCSMKARLCLLEKGVDFKSRFVDLMKWEHLTDEYKSLNPNSVVPTIVHDGIPIIESTVINQYVDEVFDGPKLTPEDPIDRAKMRVFCKMQDDILHPAIQKPTFNLLVKPQLSKKSDDELEEWLSTHPLEKSRKLFQGAARGPVNNEALEEAKTQFEFVFKRMEVALTETEWLSGSTYSLADIACAPILDRLGQCEWLDLFSPYPKLSSWGEKIREREAFQAMRPKDEQRLGNWDS